MSLSLWILLHAIPTVSAYDHVFSMSSCPEVSVRVEGISTASGWGGHISLSTSENGYGGDAVECLLAPHGEHVVALCHDGYQLGDPSPSRFELLLGERSEVDAVTFQIGERGVWVVASSRRDPPHEDATSSGFFPLDPETGFCSGEHLYYQANGVLNGQISRSGRGYSVSLRHRESTPYSELVRGYASLWYPSAAGRAAR